MPGITCVPVYAGPRVSWYERLGLVVWLQIDYGHAEMSGRTCVPENSGPRAS